MARAGASAAAMAAFEQLKAAGQAGSGIVGGAQAYWDNNVAEAERIRKLQAEQAAAAARQQQEQAAAAQRAIEDAQRAAQDRSRTQEYQAEIVRQQQAAAAAKSSLSGANSVRDALRIAGDNGNISKNELLRISSQFGKGKDQVVRQIDKVNERRGNNGKAPIGLGSAAYNDLLKTPTSRTIYGKTMTELGLGDRYNNYGSGAIGQAITQGKGTSDYYGNSTAGTGRIPQGQQVIGSYNGAPQVQVKPQSNVNAGYYGSGPSGGGAAGAGATSGGATGSTEEVVMPLPKEEVLDPVTIGGGTGSSVDGGATTFRRKKSSARASGLSTRGTGQFRNSLKVGSASGVNIGM